MALKTRKKYLCILLLLLNIFSCLFINFQPAKGLNLNSYKNNENIINVSGYLKNAKKTNYLYVISLDKMTPSERTMISTLQGLVNNKSFSQIYTLNSSQPDYKTWLDDLKNNYSVSYKIVSDPWKLINLFKDYIDGYVLYNTKNNNPSINNACSFASLNNCIAVDEVIEDNVKTYGITTLKNDCRNTDEAWAFKNLWDKGLNHSTVIQLSPNKDSALRDYAVMTKSLIFYEDGINELSFRDKVFSSMNTNSICLGWGPDEFNNVSTASKHGVSIVAADWSYNLSVLSSFPCVNIKQNAKFNIINDKDVHYVTFIMSDGDNQQWYLGNNYNSPNWFGSSYRGNFNLGWSISPSLYYLAPTVFNLYYKSASHGVFNDYFLVSPSGNGYIYPSNFEKDKLDSYIKNLNNYMSCVDEQYVTIIDDSSFYDTTLWNKFTETSNIQGLFYLDYHKHDNYHGKIIWSNNKPIISCRDLLWDNLENEDTLVKNINNRIECGETDISNPNSYTFVYVHAWTKTLANVDKAINKLSKNPKLKIVDPKTFIELVKTNINR